MKSLLNFSIPFHFVNNILVISERIISCSLYSFPELYFDNYDSIEWLGWCLGIIKLETGCLPYTDSIDQAKELLINDRDYYKNYTTDKMVKLNG